MGKPFLDSFQLGLHRSVVHRPAVEYDEPADERIVHEIFRQNAALVFFTEGVFHLLFLRGRQFERGDHRQLGEGGFVFAVKDDEIIRQRGIRPIFDGNLFLILRVEGRRQFLLFLFGEGRGRRYGKLNHCLRPIPLSSRR